MDRPVITSRVRKNRGKGTARKLRRANQIPAIFYGPGVEPVMLTVDYQELERISRQGAGENTILDLHVESDHGSETREVMLKELQVAPLNNRYLHADFYEISMDKEITVNIPIRLLNTPIGVTQGGILQHIRRELAVSCLPHKLIDALEIDVSNLDMGDSLHVRDVQLPEGISSPEEGHLTIVIIAAPSITTEKEEEIPAEEEEAARAEESAGQEEGGE